MMRRIFLFTLLLSAPAGLWADGVTDFMIDPAAGYTIAKAGSYRLAGDVTMTNDSVNALTIAANDVTVDLNGHTIKGTGLVAVGVTGIVSGSLRLRLKDGRVSDFNGVGISVGARAHLAELSVENCRSGILAGDAARIEDCTASFNSSSTADVYGIRVNDNGSVRNCTVTNNSTTGGSIIGIWGGVNVTVDGCTLAENTSSAASNGLARGIVCADYANITGNNVYHTFAGTGANGYGIYMSNGGVVRGNTSNVARGGASGVGYGIYAATGYALIESNACDYNRGNNSNAGGCGIFAAGSTRIVGNTCTDNDANGTGTSRGIEAGSDCVVERNHCSNQSGGTASYGILVTGTNTVVRENTTSGNGLAGIRLGSSGIRCELNRTADVAGISDAGGNSSGAGDLANIAY